jgi:hypothetical protein
MAIIASKEGAAEAAQMKKATARKAQGFINAVQVKRQARVSL